jgi:hypothetical protein
MLEHILVVVKRMELPEYILVAVNLVAGFGCAVALAGVLRKAYGERTASGQHSFAILYCLSACTLLNVLR